MTAAADSLLYVRLAKTGSFLWCMCPLRAGGVLMLIPLGAFPEAGGGAQCISMMLPRGDWRPSSNYISLTTRLAPSAHQPLIVRARWWGTGAPRRGCPRGYSERSSLVACRRSTVVRVNPFYHAILSNLGRRPCPLYMFMSICFNPFSQMVVTRERALISRDPASEK